MRELHQATAWILIASNAIAGVWCLIAYRFPSARTKTLWALVLISQVMPVLQAIIGAIWANTGGVLRDMHALYGFSAIVSVAILYSYRNSDFTSGDNQFLLYGFGCLFIMGLGIRNLFM